MEALLAAMPLIVAIALRILDWLAARQANAAQRAKEADLEAFDKALVDGDLLHLGLLLHGLRESADCRGPGADLPGAHPV